MENKGKNKEFVSVAELAKMLGISRVAVFKRIQKGKILAEKIGRSYVVSMEYITEMMQGASPKVLNEEKKGEIKKAVEKVVKEYGETLRLLGKE